VRKVIFRPALSSYFIHRSAMNTTTQHMEPKKIPASTGTRNLLNDLEFVLNLKFEAAYAVSVRGGHSPVYLGARKRRQLVSNRSLLHPSALKEISCAILPTFN
jgi:hypothetical protein